MGTIRRFEEIRAWQTARELTRALYRVSNAGEFVRDYGLRDQIRRAAVSIMSNIAEGFESGSRSQFVRFLGYAKASAGEVRTQLYVALDVGYLDKSQFEELFDLAEKCSRQISKFVTYLKAHSDGRRVSEGVAVYDVRNEASEHFNVSTLQPSNDE